MTHVVTKPCDGCRYTDCVVVCPVQCFYEGESMLYIHPEECIDCSLCVDECPAGAIFEESKLPEEYAHYIELNADLTKTWPLIKDKPESLPDADEWVDSKGKFQYLEMGATA